MERHDDQGKQEKGDQYDAKLAAKNYLNRWRKEQKKKKKANREEE